METKIVPANAEGIFLAKSLLTKGEVVAVPSETVYGLAALGNNKEAVAKIFLAKDRPLSDPLILHLHSSLHKIADLEAAGLVDQASYTANAKKMISLLMKAFWPGPLTLVLKKGKKVHNLITADSNFVALRMPDHPCFQDVLAGLAFPLAAPSANTFGRTSPTSAKHVFEQLSGKIPLILDGGPCTVGIESTIIKVEPDGALVLLRSGGLAIEEIENITSRTINTVSSSSEKAVAPGMLSSHYAPLKAAYLLTVTDKQRFRDIIASQPSSTQIACLAVVGESEEFIEWATHEFNKSPMTYHFLPNTMGGHEAANLLFSKLHDIDQSLAQIIIVIAPKKQNFLWRGILDRLSRATFKSSNQS